ncbi:hypothetical protein PFFVO_00373 [Plasmodium falciparum Vietnam Oak-Knoll (FVO)]|uniref:Surface antigen n=1 Tax=Plasmodium falciparum Vietnam Oak-Knoll (FVO) TaxID=1036723 RepID=A0A024VC64_PLAFA|nr:hypothetical protein PFFVO_00373 [Plasmodium falciparum Vietnam Oak-Knoll (FVO)]
MVKFSKQTQQRFEEYDERMKTTRQKCKDQCDKEIQKIILKDKLEKQMEQQLTTLETKITTEDIPTCFCEKSLADKTEKFCLNCGVNVGGGVLQASGLLGGIGAVAVHVWKPLALKAAIAAALEANNANILAAAIKAGNAHGMKIVIYYLKDWGVDIFCSEIFESILKISHYSKVKDFAAAIINKHGEICAMSASGENPMCLPFDIALHLRDAGGNKIGPPASHAIPQMINNLVGEATQGAAEVAKKASESATAEITEKQTALIEAGFNSSITSINASIIAILIIVLIMVIIYLILRYRRKKKMKKKLQYIKLLEE